MSKRFMPRASHTRERLVEIGRSLLESTDTEEVLRNIARGICEATGYERAVIVQYQRRRGQLLGRAGCGVSAEDVARIQEPPDAVPIFSEVQLSREPIVIPPEQVRGAIPDTYAQIFHVHGTLIVNALHSDRLGLLGAVFTDRSGRKFDPTARELETVQDYSDLAALSFQNALLFERSKKLGVLVERSRLAAELHDGVTQELFAASMDVAELRQVDDLPANARDIVDRLATRIGSGSHQLRSALSELAQQNEECGSADSVMEAVQAQLDDFVNHSSISVDLESYGDGPEPVDLSRDLVVRTVREGLANVVKHAYGTQSRVVLRRGRTWWTVEVLDDGFGDPSGVRVALARSARTTFGLRSLASEAAKVGGRLWVSNAPRLGGMRVSVAVPVGRALSPPFGGAE